MSDASVIVKSEAEPARDRGDAARDRRDWAQASISYKQYLSSCPLDSAIWVQLGHALKESEHHDEAEAAYRQAVDITPEDADLHLQLGHLMKLRGRTEEAVRAYVTSMRLAPTRSVNRELIALGKDALAAKLLFSHAPPIDTPHIYLQISDFCNYLLSHKTVSGIQRVQLGVIKHILAMPEDVQHRYVMAYSDESGSQLWAIPLAPLRVIADYVSGADVKHEVLKRHIATALDGAEAIRLRLGDTCMIVGAFWGGGANLEQLLEWNRVGVRSGILIYDVLPVTHPEYFDYNLANDFRQALHQTLALTDFALSISDYTAREVKRFIVASGLRDIPITTVPLAHVFKDVLPVIIENSDETIWSDAIAPMRDRSFVLCVGTIEVRKNHRLLFETWKQLISEEKNVPVLLLVGRQGWLVADLMLQLKNTRYLNGMIRIVHDLSDEELATLYRHCLFTVFPSVAEGWGLPIGESLSYGKVCVASNTSSMPEVGGELVEYIDPLNVRDAIEVLRRLIKNPASIAAKEAAIRTRFTSRTWDQVGADLVAKVDESCVAIGPKKSSRSISPTFPPGEVFSLSSLAYDPESRSQHMLRLALTGTWFSREIIGVWMEGTFGGIEFFTELRPATTVIVFLRLIVVGWTQDNTFTVADRNGTRATVELIPSHSSILRIRTITAHDGKLSLSLTVGGKVRQTQNDTRSICVGLSDFGYVPESDGKARLNMLEHILDDNLRFRTNMQSNAQDGIGTST